MGWIVLLIGSHNFGLWTELLGAGGASLGRLLCVHYVLLFLGHLLLALRSEEVLYWGIFDLISHSSFYSALLKLKL